MTREELIIQIKKKRSFLCIGLDTDLKKIPEFLLKEEDPVFEFNKKIIDSTKNYCVAYKPNIAFYEALGPRGWISLEKTLNYIPDNIFTIADAKRGDIGNTSKLYSKTFFELLDFDAITIAPYMGEDSVMPFFHPGKWVIILGLTSNIGSKDFQFLELKSGDRVFEEVIKRSKGWGNKGNMMYVVGATNPEEIKTIRKIIPDHFLLVPGIGVQGGSLNNVAEFGLNRNCGLLVNSSRSIIYADKSYEFDKVAGKKAKEIQIQMDKLLLDSGL